MHIHSNVVHSKTLQDFVDNALKDKTLSWNPATENKRDCTAFSNEEMDWLEVITSNEEFEITL